MKGNNREELSIGNKVYKGTIVIVLVGIFAKAASFLSEAILASYLGTTYQSDAYYMVWSVHAVVYPMMSVGIWNVFLPLYKGHLAKNELDQASDLTNKTITFFTTASFAVVVLLYVCASIVVSIVAPGFSGETRELCIRLVRISSPMYVFIIASAVYAAILQCHNKFLGSQIREIASHIPTIVAAVFFYNRFGINAMAFALIISGLVRLLIELPFVDWSYRYKTDFRFRSKEFALMLQRLPSALVSAGVAQLNALIDKAMASTLATGTISGLNYGHKLMNVFSGLLSSAVATALYPQMIELIAQEKQDELENLVVTILNIFALMMFPITLACILFRTELVTAVFQRGAFDATSTVLTENVFALYCIGLFFVAGSTVISNIFYGYGDTRTPMRISIINLGINVVLNMILIHIWGVNGLALATSLSAIISFIIRVREVEKLVKLNNATIIITAVKVVIASLIACVLPRIVFWVHPVNVYLTLAVSAIIAVGVYYVLIRVFRIRELSVLIGILFRKVKKQSS